ncbi:MAG: major tail protein [Chloroflexota bacterium]
MTASGEYKSNVGLRDVYYSLVTQDDQSAYAAADPDYLAPVMTGTITPASNTKTQYADDGPFDTMSSEGETKIEFELTQIPMEIRAIILGKIFDAASGRIFDNGGTPPDIALSFRSKKSNGAYHYVQYLKGKFTPPTKELASTTDTPEPKATKITYTAIKTIYQWDLLGDGSLLDGAKGVEGDEDITGFSGTTWFSAVQVPTVGSPASLTCTPSDGVAAGVSPTLTFSNALAGTPTSGISLVRVSTGAAIAGAITLDGTRKIVTINPTDDLTSGAQYLIVVAGVTDIYGQAFATTVYDFTIA